MVSTSKRSTWRANLRIKNKERQVQVEQKKAKQSIQRLKAWEAQKKAKGQKAAERLKKGREKAQFRRGIAKDRPVWRQESQKQERAAIMRSNRTRKFEVVHPDTGRINRMASSWIKSFAYDNFNQKLYMTTKTGKTYDWDRISPVIASHVIAGDASCMTNDTRKKRRWWISKNPSLGAAYWKYLSYSRK